MKIDEHNATRVQGTLTLEFEDGRTGEIEVNLDLSAYLTTFEVTPIWDRHEHTWPVLRYVIPVATKYSISIPAKLEQEGPIFVLRLPTTEELEQ